jgi:HEAT repeat protein
MRKLAIFVMLLGVFACVGCSKSKSTDELVVDVKSGSPLDRIKAVRLLQQRTNDPEHVVPALIEAFKDKDANVRLSAANGLGYFGEQAKDAIPTLEAGLRDSDSRIREAASTALTRIDPNLIQNKGRGKKG